MSAAAIDLQGVLGAFLERYLEGGRALHPRQRQICAHITTCRTAALGGVVEACGRCEWESPVRYHACRDRHCPKCQGRANAAWAERERRALLPVRYYHLVFTVPHALNPWVQPTGSSTPSPVSATPSTSSPTSPATPTAPRSPTGASSASTATEWRFADSMEGNATSDA